MSKSQTAVDPWSDPAWLDSQIERAVKEAVLDHKRTGHPIAVWENGEVKIIPPEEIEWRENDAEDDDVVTVAIGRSDRSA